MADVKITELTLLTSSTVHNDDLMIVDDDDGAVTCAIKVSELADKVLGGATIGGEDGSDITTNTGTQAINNKALGNNVSLNSGAALTVNSDELNLLDGLTASAAELNKLDGLPTTATELGYMAGATGSIQTQLTNLSAAIPSAIARTWTYAEGFTTGGAEVTHVLDWATDILAYNNLSPSSYKIDPTSVVCQLWTTSGGYTLIPWNSTGAIVTFTTTTVNSQIYLDTLTISGLTAATDYAFAMTYTIGETVGV